MKFAKGHGTENDFVLLPDMKADLDLTATAVAALCDRRRGLGADGVLRVAKAGDLADRGVLTEMPDGIGPDDWFMDYRNADGSIAEMCGNGVRVFAHYLLASGLESARSFVVGSRAGARPVEVASFDALDADVTVHMGQVRTLGTSTAVLDGRKFDGIGIDVGNPHLACVDGDLDVDALLGLDLTEAPDFDADLFPAGVNIEFVTAPRDGAVHMRVFERGIGETRSCGTGTVAVAAAALRWADTDSGDVTVRIPGGEVQVSITADGALLRGPSMIVATGDIDDAWWSRYR